MSYFSLSHLFSRVGKLQQMAKKKYQTVGDVVNSFRLKTHILYFENKNKVNYNYIKNYQYLYF